jgi:hypothetical protein
MRTHTHTHTHTFIRLFIYRAQNFRPRVKLTGRSGSGSNFSLKTNYPQFVLAKKFFKFKTWFRELDGGAEVGRHANPRTLGYDAVPHLPAGLPIILCVKIQVHRRYSRGGGFRLLLLRKFDGGAEVANHANPRTLGYSAVSHLSAELPITLFQRQQDHRKCSGAEGLPSLCCENLTGAPRSRTTPILAHSGTARLPTCLRGSPLLCSGPQDGHERAILLLK